MLTEPQAAQIKVERDVREPESRFYLWEGERFVGEVYFDFDHFDPGAEKPVGWCLRRPHDEPDLQGRVGEPLRPDGRTLSWAATDAAVAEALRRLGERLAA